MYVDLGTFDDNTSDKYLHQFHACFAISVTNVPREFQRPSWNIMVTHATRSIKKTLPPWHGLFSMCGNDQRLRTI